MEYKFSIEEQNIQSTIRKFVKNELLPIYRQLRKEGDLPEDVNKNFMELGILALAFPEECGGAGSSFTSFILAIEELGYASLIPPMKILENYITALPLYRFGSDFLKEKYLKDLISMKITGAMAFTEPNTGSDPRQLVTTAEKVDGGWKLNGTKRFITQSEACDIMLVYAKIENGAVAAFLIDSSRPGYKLGRRESLMNMTMDNGDVYLEDYFVPDDHLLGNLDQGFDVLLQTEAMGKLGFSAIFTGAARRALDLSIDYAGTRMHRDKPIGIKFQFIQEKIARMVANVEAMRTYLYRTTSKVDAGQDTFTDSAVLKIIGGDGVRQVVADAMEIHGAYSLSDEYDIAAVYELAAFAPVVMGTMDIQRTIVARSYLAKGKYTE